MADNLHRRPLVLAGIFLGIGLGGFVDGIVLHQILQVHNMLSSRFPPDTLVNAKINMTWDGYFHAAVFVMVAVGLYLLFRAGQQRNVPWSGKILLGSLIAGWGLFNLVEGIINHQILGIHHVYEYATNKLPFDLGFLLFGGVLLLLVGWLLIRAGSHDTFPRGEVS
ncbi:MAG: DUF2243 domain-containing protein [Timaviella obliquedivisa GSE-PSE-MK23-08B]|jgi:uncharacterized membrane protein|nr:DUF2243 domain-containing protein [Timaviella obliquedivisa GSE-PSE-MK23-08B]